MDILIRVRYTFIDKENKFIFTLPNSIHPILGYKVLQQFAKKRKIQKPEAITTRGLRKHLATICQLFHMREEEVEQLSTFMGHSQATHRSNYRLPDDVFQTAKITTLLLMMEKGEGQKYKGMTLDEIYIQLEEEIQPENEEESDEENGMDLSLESVFQDLNNTPQAPFSTKKLGKITKTKKREFHSWTQEQKITMAFFANEIKLKCPPKKNQVLYFNNCTTQTQTLISPSNGKRLRFSCKTCTLKKLNYLNEDHKILIYIIEKKIMPLVLSLTLVHFMNLVLVMKSPVPKRLLCKIMYLRPYLFIITRTHKDLGFPM